MGFVCTKNGFCIKFSSTLITDLEYSTPLVKKVFRGDMFVDESTGMRKIYIKKAQDSLVGYSYDILANKVLYDRQKQDDLLKEFIEYISKK